MALLCPAIEDENHHPIIDYEAILMCHMNKE